MHAWLSGIRGDSLPYIYTEEKLGLQYISEEQGTISEWHALGIKPASLIPRACIGCQVMFRA